MPLRLAEVKLQYKENKDLKKDNVEALLNWVKKQPHLPKINELQAILFLHSCNYNNEFAKDTIDKFFTYRTHFPEVFQNRNVSKHTLQAFMDFAIITPLPKKTPEGYIIFLIKLVDSNPDNFHLATLLKHFDMVCMSEMYLEGVSTGHIFIVDLELLGFGFFIKMRPLTLKKYLVYFQEAMPLVLKGMHFLGAGSIMDTLLVLLKPFMGQEMINMLHLHQNIDSLTKFTPFEYLPEDYGGSLESIAVLQKRFKVKLEENVALFGWEESSIVDETKRVGQLKNNDTFGTNGTFKKLEID